MKVLMGQVQQVERTMEEVKANKSKVSHLQSMHTAGMTRAGVFTLTYLSMWWEELSDFMSHGGYCLPVHHQ